MSGHGGHSGGGGHKSAGHGGGGGGKEIAGFFLNIAKETVKYAALAAIGLFAFGFMSLFKVGGSHGGGHGGHH